MFITKSYIMIPEKEILSTQKYSINEAFVEITDEKRMLKILKEIDFDYLNGAIYLEYEGQVLLSFELWDLIDQLWAYFINMIEDYAVKGIAQTYFPDQPVKIIFKKVTNDLVLFTIEVNKKVSFSLPKKEFFTALLDASEKFFEKMNYYLSTSVNGNYKNELLKIKSLRNML